MTKHSEVSNPAPFDFSDPHVFIKTTHMISTPSCFINGEWVPSCGRDTTVEDPCTGESIGSVPNFSKVEATAAIAAAQTALQTWRTSIPHDRAMILRRWADLILRHQAALGNILSRESGKVVAESKGEVLYAESYVEWYMGEAERIYGDILPCPRPGVQATVVKEPVGVVGVITPWNFPAAMVTRAVAGALAAGCTVVLKPSSLTPFTALALVQLAQEAGVPAGVLNVITGNSKEIADTMLESFDVRKIAFTGSTEVGKNLYRGSAATMKKLGLELGGNAPFIVFDDADLEKALDGFIQAKFRNAGQTCISCNRVFVQAGVYEKFKAALVSRMEKLKIGNCFDPDVQIGALINRDAVTRMEEVVRDAVAHGARVDCGGAKLTTSKGYFFKPTVISTVNHKSARWCEKELFGPIVPVVEFDSEEEVISLANATRSGLAAYVFTNNNAKQFRVSAALQFGMVGINNCGLSTAVAPFGGIKESGLGRDGSKYGIDSFLNMKYILRSIL